MLTRPSDIAQTASANVTPISRLSGERGTVAGVRIAFQRPPTARGFTFVTLEDESGRVQIIVPPKVYPIFETVLRSSALIVSGRAQRVGAWRGLVHVLPITLLISEGCQNSPQTCIAVGNLYRHVECDLRCGALGALTIERKDLTLPYVPD